MQAPVKALFGIPLDLKKKTLMKDLVFIICTRMIVKEAEEVFLSKKIVVTEVIQKSSEVMSFNQIASIDLTYCIL